MSTSDFADQLNGKSLITMDILYYRPDHPKLLQSFTWQTLDQVPQYPRIKQFLDHWRAEIEAIIHSIRLAHQDTVRPPQWRKVDALFTSDGRPH